MMAWAVKAAVLAAAVMAITMAAVLLPQVNVKGKLIASEER
jgi:hypothetical protein